MSADETNNPSLDLKPALIGFLVCEFLLLAVTAAAWVFIPDGQLVPIHWGITGSADCFAPKLVGLLAVPLMVPFIAMLIWLQWKVDRSCMSGAIRETMSILFGVFGLFILVQVLIVASAMSVNLPVSQIIIGAIGLLLLWSGNVSRGLQIDPSRKIPWRLARKESWLKYHAYVGRMLEYVGAAIALSSFAGTLLAACVVLGGVVALVCGSMMYAYHLWKEEQLTAAPPNN